MEKDVVTKNVTNSGGFMVNNVKIRLFRRGINTPSPNGKKTKKYSWSARFTDPITGVEGNPVAVSSLRKKIGSVDSTPIKTRDEAIWICQKAVELGVAFASNYNPSFIDYCLEYWDFKKSTYVRDLLLEDPNAISENYCHNSQSIITNHVLRFIPQTRKLASIKRTDIEHLKRCLMEEGSLSAETTKKVLKAVQQPLRYALHQGLIANDPSQGITVKTNGKASERGCYSTEQIGCLLKYCDVHRNDSLADRRLWLAVELAARTGLRLGEIRALRYDKIAFTSSEVGSRPALIDVSESFAARVGVKKTKGKRSRVVPVPEWLGKELVSFSNECPRRNNAYVFWSEKKDAPIGEHTLRDKLYEVLCTLEMENDEKGNPLGFHSFRHFLNSIVRHSGILTDTQLRSIIGHQSEKMSDLYTHESEESAIASGIKLEGFFEAIEA